MGSRVWSGGKRRKPFLCPVCGKRRFATDQKLKNHLDKKHSGKHDK